MRGTIDQGVGEGGIAKEGREQGEPSPASGCRGYEKRPDLVVGMWRNGAVPDYLTTTEAAEYLRRSVSWLVKRNDIPYLRGVPNIYCRADLDAWFQRTKVRPKVV